MPSRIETYRNLLRDENVRSISRRYFISNGFDGTLTCIGIIVGSFLGGSQSAMEIVRVVAGGTVGLAASGVWSVWEIERAEKLADVQSIERAMLTDLDDTQVMRSVRHARAVNAIMSGIGPLIGILVPLSPYAFVGVGLTMLTATLAAIALGVLVLFVFGAYLGTISRQTWYVAGIRMGLAGLVVAALNLLAPG